ncbi:MAG TPA: hypothetical protein VFL80_03275 [Thermoanaerobaculia bacterium]|nr:hypothetical protein [Thermoanaerobaculia bacterium]
MPRLIWMMLDDGRAVVAGCLNASRVDVARAFSQPGRTVTLTSDDAVETISAARVRRFMLLESVRQVPPSNSIYRLMQV